MILASNQITFQKQGLGVLTFLNNLKALKNFWKIIRLGPRFPIRTIVRNRIWHQIEIKLL